MRPAVRLLKSALFGLGCTAILLAATTARADDDAPKKKISYGLFGIGLHVEAGAGVYQVVGQGGWVPGIYPRVGAELHLGPHFSIPVIARLQQSVDQGVPDFAQVSVSAGANVRFREADWPFAIVLGAGVRFGKFTASQQLADAQFETAQDQGAQDALGFPLSPEGTAKFEWWIASPLALKVSVTYSPMFMPNQVMHNIEEALALALVF
ncbi:MAG: hypothetical protein IPM54_41935 [Polyangiaceae bacterium]|nr:hypothetical protein [Polyangiaceae bacterium]